MKRWQNWLKDLKSVLIPPEEPIRPEQNWRKAERELGLRLPTDFKQFNDDYGLGGINNYLWFSHPCEVAFGESFAESMVRILADRRMRERTVSRAIPFKYYPAKPGLLPAANTMDSCFLYFHATDSDSDRWPIVVVAERKQRMRWTTLKNVCFVQVVFELVNGDSPLFDRLVPRKPFKGRPEFIQREEGEI